MATFDPLGRGLTFPIRRAGRDFETAAGAELLAARVHFALSVRGPAGTMRGEIPWNGSRGSKLFLLKNAPLSPMLLVRAQRYVAEALAELPWVELVSVDVRRTDARSRETFIDVTWTLSRQFLATLGGTDHALRSSLTTVRI